MDSLQKQVIALSHKVDTLYHVIEQLSQKVSEGCLPNRQTASKASDHTGLGYYPYPSSSRFDSVMEHKDVIADGSSLESNSHSSEKELAPEIQIQRLTAQLTAAYNRIAALEEQLLARRIHS